jgi:hypothetical protein
VQSIDNACVRSGLGLQSLDFTGDAAKVLFVKELWFLGLSCLYSFYRMSGPVFAMRM